LIHGAFETVSESTSQPGPQGRWGQVKKEAHITFVKIKVIMGELSTQGPINTSIGTSGSTLGDHSKTTIKQRCPEMKIKSGHDKNCNNQPKKQKAHQKSNL